MPKGDRDVAETAFSRGMEVSSAQSFKMVLGLPSDGMSSSRTVPAVTIVVLLLAAAVPVGLASLTAGRSPSSAEFRPDLRMVGPFVPAVACGPSSLCPVMVLSAYNMTGVVNRSATNGTGETIVIVDACGDSSIRTDIATFDSTFHLPPVSLKITHLGNGTNCHKGGWSVETALDVEWAHTMAPGAAIHLVLPKSGTNSIMFTAWNYSLANHLGDQISDSWGGPGGCNATTKSYLTTAANDGVTVLASSGDGGSWGAGTSSSSFLPADCKRVLTVGGTALTLSTKAGYGSETGWSYSGGGYATRYPEPAYQVTANISDSYGVMAKPDVAAVADPSTGVWVYDSSLGGWGVVGGTSVSCPIWAGFIADVNDLRSGNGFAPLGDFHAYLYGSVYGSAKNYSASLHDVKRGSNGWSAGTGWDAVTGVGSMNGSPLLQQLGNDPNA